MKTQLVALQVKIISLADEARTIRRKEQQALARRPVPKFVPSGRPGGEKKPKRPASRYADYVLYKSLYDHRVKDLRQEQRMALLAYALLRGVPYAVVETSKKEIDWKRVAALVSKFGGLENKPIPCSVQTVVEWLKGSLPAGPFTGDVAAEAVKV